MAGATGVAEEEAKVDAAGANGVKAGEDRNNNSRSNSRSSSINSISISISNISSSTHNSNSSNNSSNNTRSSNSSISTSNSNNSPNIIMAAAVEVAVGAGGSTHSSGELRAEDAAAGEAVEGMQEIVRQQVGVGE